MSVPVLHEESGGNVWEEQMRPVAQICISLNLTHRVLLKFSLHAGHDGTCLYPSSRWIRLKASLGYIVRLRSAWAASDPL